MIRFIPVLTMPARTPVRIPGAMRSRSFMVACARNSDPQECRLGPRKCIPPGVTVVNK
jgi:hypothetical protein